MYVLVGDVVIYPDERQIRIVGKDLILSCSGLIYHAYIFNRSWKIRSRVSASNFGLFVLA